MSIILYERGFRVDYEHSPGVICVLLLASQAGDHVRPHPHNFPHDMECVSGSADVLVGGRGVVMLPGDRIHIPAGVWHSAVAREAGTTLRCVHAIRKENGEVDPFAYSQDGIPLEWLRNLQNA